YTVPGQVLYERTRVALLNGVDGIVQVIDSQRDKLEESLTSLRELAQNIAQQRRDFRALPLVLQYNKRDLPTALPVSVLDHYLNSMQVTRLEAVAATGVGVFPTLRAIAQQVMASL
ncbi:MAG: ADP-ribosylation factor-like protein, partial [Chloroflexi bacterium]|nr:ADP-ribosylation factor-like protein [Chloroflexota bacterium]